MDTMEQDFFSDPSIIDDPRPYFEAIRKAGPVVQEPFHATFMVTGYDAALELFNCKDDSFSSAVSVIGPIPPLPFTPEGDDIGAQLDAHRRALPWSAHLACFDGATHARYRGLLGALLTYKRLKANEEYLVGLADRMIDGFVADGQCEVASRFAHAIATYAVSDLMGIPEGDRPTLLALLGAPPSQLDGDAVHKVGPDPLIFLKPMFDAYLHARQARPTGDLLSDLANATLRDGGTPEFDIVSGLARFLFGAGQDTTSRLITMGVRFLADDSALQDRLRAAPERIPDFIEEVLRVEAPVKAIYRIARRSTTLAGVPIPAGSIIAVCLTALNHDPARFEEPRRFDIDRPNLRENMAFSRGLHACLGAPLGRMEARVALERLLARTRRISLDAAHHGPPGQRHFRFEPTYSFRSLSALHVSFDAA